jgi:tetratricopeptide (TPR) repeat protein
MQRQMAVSPNTGTRAMHFDPFALPHSSLELRQNVFCEKLRVPIIVKPTQTATSMPVVWLKSGQTLRENPPKTADWIPSPDASDENPIGATPAAFFNQAMRCLASGDMPKAEQFIQKALTELALNPNRPDGAANTQSWQTLAICSLLKGDLDSCETWLRQAERSFHGKGADVSSAEFQIGAGDQLAIQACLFAQTNHHKKAIQMLADASQCHLKGHAHASVAQDLVLQARMLARDREWVYAELAIEEAERAIEHLDDVSRAEAQRLGQIVSSDRAAINAFRKTSKAAEWN